MRPAPAAGRPCDDDTGAGRFSEHGYRYRSLRLLTIPVGAGRPIRGASHEPIVGQTKTNSPAQTISVTPSAPFDQPSSSRSIAKTGRIMAVATKMERTK